jgi:hypothetical protein
VTERLKLPPLTAGTYSGEDPQWHCALCQDSGWERCYELVTWRKSGRVKRELISRNEYEAFAPNTEGPPQREVYTSSRPCKCSSGDKFRESYARAEGSRIDPLPTKPSRSEKRTDGKAKASGE